MDERLKANLDAWNQMAEIHAASRGYRLAEFKAGENVLKPIELREVGDVACSRGASRAIFAFTPASLRRLGLLRHRTLRLSSGAAVLQLNPRSQNRGPLQAAKLL